MFDVLNRVREKSQSQRRAIALSAAAIITGVIFIIWMISFFASIQNEQKLVDSPKDAFEFSSFVNSFQEAGTIIKKEIGSARDQFELINNELQKTEGVAGEDIEKNVEELDTPVHSDEFEEKTEITPSGVEIIQVEN